ncbi:MAG: hypothetical protein ABFS03_00605 [Chloroflexota bacterium]
MMKVGILDAFPPGKSVVNWYDTPIDTYIRFLESAHAPFEYQGYIVSQGEFPESVDACDAYLITGSPKGVYNNDVWIANLERFIQVSYRAGKKLVGICFGHQILAQALGGRVEKSEKGWGLGLDTFKLSAHMPWMTETPDHCALYFVHQDQVIELPPGAELLGGNDFCPNLIFTIDNQALGIQGHPEFGLEIMGDIMLARKDTVGEDVYQKALDSLDNGKPDNQLFAEWIVNFFTGSTISH